MTDWVRLYHDMPTDPKWRVIARKSGQCIGDVIAVAMFLLTNGSANANERGRTQANATNFHDDIAATIDLDVEHVSSIIEAMRDRFIDKSGKIVAWEKRNPIKDDGAAERAKAWRERKRTQTNGANALESESEKDTEKKKDSPSLRSEFDEKFWPLVPKKVGLEDCWKAFRTARKTVELGPLMLGMQRYAAKRAGEDRQYTKSPAAWLRGGHWSDEDGAAVQTSATLESLQAQRAKAQSLGLKTGRLDDLIREKIWARDSGKSLAPALRPGGEDQAPRNSDQATILAR